MRVAGTPPSAELAGIYAWSCDETLVQFNEIRASKATRTSTAWDTIPISTAATTCPVQLQPRQCRRIHGRVSPRGGLHPRKFGNVGNQGTIIRYNASRNDGRVSRAIFYHVAGGAKNAQI